MELPRVGAACDRAVAQPRREFVGGPQPGERRDTHGRRAQPFAEGAEQARPPGVGEEHLELFADAPSSARLPAEGEQRINAGTTYAYPPPVERSEPEKASVVAEQRERKPAPCAWMGRPQVLPPRPCPVP